MPKQGHGYIGGDRRPDTTTLGELGESGLVKEGAVGGTTFTATTVFMPPQQQQSGPSLMMASKCCQNGFFHLL
jgi:hypothetical protein